MNKPHDVWGDDEDRDLEDQASPRPQHTGLSLHRLRLGVRRKSTSDSKGGEVPSLSTSSTLRESVAEPTVVLSKQDKSFRHDLTHSKSNADIHNCKAEWGAEIVAHGSMQDSLGRFRKDVEEYEAKAGLRQWEDTLLPLAETNFQELNELMKRTAEKEQSRKHRAWRWYDGFSAVALEYSKLLDVVMEACPDYVSMAWGTMKILLVADINHQNLKENVRRCLIDIGGRLGIVNQLLCYSPTEKMVEAVALLHASFSKFLGKALKYYCKSKLLSIAQAFTFPWETRFAKTVNMIDVRFNHIQEIAHASHFHVTIQNNHVLHSINDCVHKQGSALQRDYSPARLLSETKKKMKDEVREELRADFKKEILTALEDFSPQWLQHFEEIISRKHRKRNPEPLNYHNDARGYTAAGLDGPAALPDVDYLATHAVSSEDVLKFRDSCFPSCRQSDVGLPSSSRTSDF